MIELPELYNAFAASSGVSTDTRKIMDDNIFFALKGENFDGNQYAGKALDNGAKFAVVDDPKVATHKRFLVVPDVLETLQALGRYHRRKLGIPIIGLTGSNGKTTTKELIREVLATKFRVKATQGNLNNHIGVPLTLLSMSKETEIGVVEMGANHPGEIAMLCSIAEPTHGMITNIGKAHLEGFGSYEGVLRAKSELYDHLIKNNGQIFANSEDAVLKNMCKRAKDPKFYNGTDDFYTAQLLTANPFVVYEDESSSKVSTQLLGTYNFKNIAAALCIGKFFGVDAAAANQAIAAYVPQNNRSQLIETGKNKVILDAYNANPISMNAALDTLAVMEHSHKVAILGDMFELGVDEYKEHQAIVDRLSTMEIERAIVCGLAMNKAAEGTEKVNAYTTRKELEEYLEANSLQGSLILVKASRGMGLENLLKHL